MGTPNNSTRVFILDDVHETLDFCRASLETARYRVVTHDRLVGAVAAICYEKPDIALLAVNLTLAGDKIVRPLRMTSGCESVFLLHSSLPVETLRLRVLTSGAHGYVRKTQNPAELIQQITDWSQQGLQSVRMSLDPLALPNSQTRISQTRIRIPNAPPKGAGETVASPSERSPASWVPSERMKELPASGTMRIPIRTLFVHPDPAMLEHLQTTIDAEVSGRYAATQEEALAHFSSGSPPEVAVVSLALRGCHDLYERVRDLHVAPAPRFLFLAVSAMTAAHSGFEGEPGVRVLRAPLSTRELLEAIEHLRDRPRKSRAR